MCANLDDDGLPYIGQRMVKGDPLWCAIDESSCRAKKELHNYAEEATVEEVRLLAPKSGGSCSACDVAAAATVLLFLLLSQEMIDSD